MNCPSVLSIKTVKPQYSFIPRLIDLFNATMKAWERAWSMHCWCKISQHVRVIPKFYVKLHVHVQRMCTTTHTCTCTCTHKYMQYLDVPCDVMLSYEPSVEWLAPGLVGGEVEACLFLDCLGMVVDEKLGGEVLGVGALGLEQRQVIGTCSSHACTELEWKFTRT